MRVLITYFSQTGNTEKIARAIYKELQFEKEIKPLDKVHSLDEFDLIFLGFPIINFGPAEPIKLFLAELAKGKNIALFITHATPSDHPRLQGMVDRWIIKCRDYAASANLMGIYHCEGELSQAMADEMSKSDSPVLQKFASMRSVTEGRPNDTDLAGAAVFAREVLAKLHPRVD